MQVDRLSRARAQQLGPAGVAARVRTLIPGVESVSGQVREILAQVQRDGDAAVLELTSRFDLKGEPARELLVSPSELDEAIKAMDREVIAGLQVAISNVAEVASSTAGIDFTTSLPQGHSVTLRELPVDSAAVYVPGGRAPYPSTAVMGVVTARAAGVLDVCVCSPPGSGADIDPVVLGACRLLGVERVYRMGGAQAISALAYGTQTVRRVDVIVGPGNLYVQEAKRQLSDRVGIDSIAGPSDLVVAFGGDADLELVALDLLAQAEHGQGSLVVAVCPHEQVLDELEVQLNRLGEGHPGIENAAFSAVCSDDAADAVAIADAIAPEHLELIGAEVEALAPTVRHAGCLFVGAGSATAFGDYVAGSNHILPTGGAARFSSVLNAGTFRRRMAEVRVPEESARMLAAAAAPVARAEGFELHALSMLARAESQEASEATSTPPMGENP
ncbi:MAG TPA: histidinol dehydrogenase [Solirubrobacteraceae bacterium]|nr:histidinol dehydrogenase [Solirubrobacteraceae bacterium]